MSTQTATKSALSRKHKTTTKTAPEAAPAPNLAPDVEVLDQWKPCTRWKVSGAGEIGREIEAPDSVEAVLAFCALVMTGGNLAEVGNGIANDAGAVEFVATVDGSRHLLTVEAVR